MLNASTTRTGPPMNTRVAGGLLLLAATAALIALNTNIILGGADSSKPSPVPLPSPISPVICDRSDTKPPAVTRPLSDSAGPSNLAHDAIGVLLPPLPTRKPRRRRCGGSTPGHWTGDSPPFIWHVDDPSCAYSVSTQFDFLARFTGKRLLMIGDSTTREFATDFMRVMLGCAKYAPIRYSPAFGPETLGGPFSASAHAACESLRYTAGGESWKDMNVSLPVGSTGEVVELLFCWVQWPSQLSSKWWWNDIVLKGDFDAAVFNSYLHISRAPKSGYSSDNWYAHELDVLVASLASAPPDVLAKLKRRFYWRRTFPSEDTSHHSNFFKREPLGAASEVATSVMRSAGYTVVSLDKYFQHERCVDSEGKSTGLKCVTGDGLHPTGPTSLAMSWELWSIVADALDDEEQG